MRGIQWAKGGGIKICPHIHVADGKHGHGRYLRLAPARIKVHGIFDKGLVRGVEHHPVLKVDAQAEREWLFKQEAQLEMELSQAREQVLELMRPGNDQSGKAEMLTMVNCQAVRLSKQLTNVSERCRANQRNSITE